MSTDPTAASRQRINIFGPDLSEMDRAIALAGAEVGVDRERYRLALLAMLSQALSVEQLEELCHHAQWTLELNATDRAVAARAIMAQCDRVIDGKARARSSANANGDAPLAMRLGSDIAMEQQIRRRWVARVIPVQEVP